MATRMLQRRGTAAEWSSENPVLSAGEIGIETDTGIIKVGNGVDAWSALTMAWLPVAGGTMTGALLLSTAPTLDNHAVRKQDLDSRPLGEIAYADLSSNSVGGTLKTHTGLTLTDIPIIVGRTYAVRFEGTTLVTGATATGSRVSHQIRDSGVVVQYTRTTDTLKNLSAGTFSVTHRFTAAETTTKTFTFSTEFVDQGPATDVGLVASSDFRPYSQVLDLGS